MNTCRVDLLTLGVYIPPAFVCILSIAAAPCCGQACSKAFPIAAFDSLQHTKKGEKWPGKTCRMW